jgi:hypothetical protein
LGEDFEKNFEMFPNQEHSYERGRSPIEPSGNPSSISINQNPTMEFDERIFGFAYGCVCACRLVLSVRLLFAAVLERALFALANIGRGRKRFVIIKLSGVSVT